MENSKPSTSDKISNKYFYVCKGCKKTFKDSVIFKHITHNSSCESCYTKEDITNLKKSAKERKRIKDIEYWDRNKDSIAKKRKEKYEEKK